MGGLPLIIFITGIIAFMYIATNMAEGSREKPGKEEKNESEKNIIKNAEENENTLELEKENEIRREEKPSEYRNKYADALGIFAAIELIGSIISAIYIWTNYGTVEVSKGAYYTYTSTETNPLGVGLGFGVLFQGIVIFVILSALKTMAGDIVEIKNLSNRNS